jgi:beta-lysine 5,6-aminomutase beta subunit
VRPYGDTTGDGQVQASFTLPVPGVSAADRALAEGAALQLAGKMGLSPAMVVHTKPIGHSFTFFVVYGRVIHLVDMSAVVVPEREFELLSPAEVNLRIRAALGREMVVVGATIGTDAHTVGIDAILNVKGHAGEKGLEYYREIRVFNMGAQVPIPAVVARGGGARRRGAGQPGGHSAGRAPVQRQGTRRSHSPGTGVPRSAGVAAPLLVIGGPRFDPSSAASLGVDKIFGRGTTPGEVASYLVHALAPEVPS